MKKIIFLFILLFLIGLLPVFAQETAPAEGIEGVGGGYSPVTTDKIELPDPGLTPDSPFYFLKFWKESIQTFFTFGAENKAEQYLHLAEVRLAEYQKMIEKALRQAQGEAPQQVQGKKLEIAEKTLEKYERQLNRALEKAEEAKEKGKDVEKLKETISERILKHQEVLENVLEKVPEQAKQGIEKAIEASQKGFENAIQAVTGEKKEELQKKAEEVKIKVETADWKTYKNEKYGYSFKYPPDCFYGPMPVYCKEKPPEERPSECLCFLDGQDPNRVFLQAFTGEKDNLILASFEVIHYDTSLYNPRPGTDLIKWLGEKFSGLHKNIPDRPNMEIDGIPAVKIYEPGGVKGTAAWLSGENIYFIRNDMLFEISMLDVDSESNKKLYKQILSTFEFVELEKAEEEAPKIEEVPRVEEKPIAPSTPALKAPVLRDPGISVKKHEVFTLNWTSVEGAKRYWLQRDTSTNFSIPAWYCEINSDTDNPGVGTSAPEVTTTYYYRVKACDDRECGHWSNVVDMQVIVPSITVTSPNGGEKWVIGNTYEITWTAVGVNKVTLRVNYGGGYLGLGATIPSAGVDATLGKFSWQIPSNLPYAPGDNLKIKITDDSNSTIYDESDNYFTIASLSSTCSAPEDPVVSAVPTGPVNSGAEYSINWSIVAGASHYILQRDTNLTFSNPSVIYSGSLLHTKKESHSPSVSTVYWYKARAENSCGVGPWSNIVGIKVEVPAVPAASVLTDPGISVKEHEAFTLNWTSVSGATSYILRRDTNSSFSNPVTVYSGPLNSFSGDFSPSVSTTYYFRVEACNDTGGCSSGSNIVDMQVIVPSITVTSPNGGETLKPGEALRITWSSVGVDSVRITLSCLVQRYDMTKNVPVPAASGYYDGIIPSIKPGCEGDDYKIEIADSSNGATQDYSNSYFSIVVPSITVISPNGGETWTIGQTRRVSWSSTGVNYVRIYVYDESIVGSGSTNYIYDGAISASTGYYDWTIQKGQLPGSTLGFPRNYKIIVDGVNEATLGSTIIVWDQSDSYFSIIDGALGLENIRNQLASVSEVIPRLMENIKKLVAGPVGILSGSYGVKVLAQETDLLAVSGVELPKPGLTPDSFFYFLDTWGEKMGMFFAFGADKKAEKAFQYAGEKLAEARTMAGANKIEALKKAGQKYQEYLVLFFKKGGEAYEAGKDVAELEKISKLKSLNYLRVLADTREEALEEAKTEVEKIIKVSREFFGETIWSVHEERMKKGCLVEGETYMPGDDRQCCAGLKGMAVTYGDGKYCTLPMGFVCSAFCGDGGCRGEYENACSCPEDCPKSEKEEISCTTNSDCGVDTCQQGRNKCVEIKYVCENGECSGILKEYKNYSCAKIYSPELTYPESVKCLDTCGDGICRLPETKDWCPEDCSPGSGQEPTEEGPVVGGPCSYNTFKGKCEITSILNENTIKFRFTPTEPPNLEGIEWAKKIIDREYYEEYAGYLGLKCLDKYPITKEDLEKCNIKENAIFSCGLKVITSGTCTPINFKFY